MVIPQKFYLTVLSTPDLPMNVFDWQLQTDNLVTY